MRILENLQLEGNFDHVFSHLFEPMTFSQLPSRQTALKPLIEKYAWFHHCGNGEQMHKSILPCAGISLLFNFKGMQLNTEPAPEIMVIGLHETVYHIEPLTNEVKTLIARFSPWGCSRLTDFPIDALTNCITDATLVFGPEIRHLYKELDAASDLTACVSLLDVWFLDKLKMPDAANTVISKIADKVKSEPELVSFEEIRKKEVFPFGTRQMARRFKSTVGVNLRAFIRICRFERAKLLFFSEQGLSLTNIGYLSGYYDQPHFSREFKKLSGSNARDFFPFCALQKLPEEEA